MRPRSRIVSPLEGCEHARANAEDQREHERSDGDLERHKRVGRNERGDRLVEEQRVAQVQRQRCS